MSKNLKLTIAAITSLAILSGCGSFTVPASGLLSDGTVLTGTTTAAASGGTFEVTGGGITCSGTYDAMSSAKRIQAPASCSDGRTGTLDIVRNADGLGGVATGTFSDGTTGEFVFGKKT